jgi:hypothetical protein
MTARGNLEERFRRAQAVRQIGHMSAAAATLDAVRDAVAQGQTDGAPADRTLATVTDLLTKHDARRQTYFVTVVERHIRSDADRDAGIRDVPLGSVQGNRSVVEAHLLKVLARVRPLEVHEIHLYGQDADGVNVNPILRGHFAGHELVGALAEAGWPIGPTVQEESTAS